LKRGERQHTAVALLLFEAANKHRDQWHGGAYRRQRHAPQLCADNVPSEFAGRRSFCVGPAHQDSAQDL